MLDLIVVDGRARGIVVRDLVTGEIDTYFADAVVLATGGYGNVFYLSTNAKGCNVTAIWRAHRRGALLRQPLLHADPPDLHPAHRRPPVEADADERVAAQRRPGLGAEGARATTAPPDEIPEDERDYYLERHLPGLRQPGARATSPPAPRRTSATRAAASAPAGWASTSTSPTRSSGWAGKAVEAKYGNLFEMYAADHRRGPVRGADAHLPGRALHDGRPVGRLRPAVHDPRPVRDRRGQLLRPRRQPARRLRADAGPGRRLLRAARHDRRLPAAARSTTRSTDEHPAVAEVAGRVEDRLDRLLAVDGDRTVDSFHRELGELMWEYCGMERTDDGPAQGARARSRSCARSSGGASRCPAPARSSTSRWRRPAGSPTSSSSPS